VGAGVSKLNTSGEIALVSNRMGKPSLVLGGYWYRINGKNSRFIIWMCVKDMR